MRTGGGGRRGVTFLTSRKSTKAQVGPLARTPGRSCSTGGVAGMRNGKLLGSVGWTTPGGTPMSRTLGSFSATSMHGVPMLVLAGEIGHESCPELRRVLETLLEEADNRLLLDFHAVDYIDSGCVGLMWALFQSLVGRGWMGVIGANMNVSRILSVCGFTEDDTFRLFETRAAVELALAGQSQGIS